MKLAIISTTIHGEKGYLPYDRLAMQSKFSEVRFFIAADLKSPPFNTKMFQCSIEYIDVDTQKKFYCSEPMGWNKIMRRNIALLCAIGSKPDYILTIDDDNIPSDDYFDKWYEIITQPVKRIVTPVNGGYDESYWHNYLEYRLY